MHRLLLLVALLLTAQAGLARSKPNVLLLVIDDLRPALGAYGDARAHTPNIDALAERSIVFEHAFAPVPVCGASRAAMLSGRKPTTQRFLTYNSRLDRDLPVAPTLPGYFKSQGYHVLGNGKIFDVTDDSAHSWSAPVWNPPGQWYSPVTRQNRHEDLQKAYLAPLTGKLGPAFERLPAADTDYPDGLIAAKTVADLGRLPQQPFFLAMGLRKPHLPFTAPSRYWALLDESEFELPATYNRVPEHAPTQAIHNSPELRRQYADIPPQGALPVPQALALIKAYYAAVAYIDAQVGEVLAALDRSGLDDNTIIVLIGDHGWNLGEHTLWTKHSLFDVTLRVPMLIASPEHAPARNHNITDLLDLFPTLVDLAGLPEIEGLDGMSLRPLMETPQKSHERASFARWFDGESVRTRNYRYTEWRDAQNNVTDRMLFDLAVDPEETVNVARQPGYAEVVAYHHELISANATNLPWDSLLSAIVEQRDAQGSRRGDRRGQSQVPGLDRRGQSQVPGLDRRGQSQVPGLDRRGQSQVPES